MKMKKIISAILFLIAIMPLVNAAVTMPYPGSLKLEKGESGLFKFQVQSNNPGELLCNYEMKDDFPLSIDFTKRFDGSKNNFALLSL